MPIEPIRIACVGASVTFGRGLENRREECYPAVLQRMLDQHTGALPCQVRNFGYSGATASRGSNEPYWDTPSFTSATRYEPQLAVMMLGTNDAQFANAEARQSLARDYADLVEHFRTLGAEVFASNMPPAFPPVAEIDFEALTQEVRPTIVQVIAELGIPMIDFYSPIADQREEFPDGLHPTAKVAKQIAEIAFDAISGSELLLAAGR